MGVQATFVLSSVEHMLHAYGMSAKCPSSKLKHERVYIVTKVQQQVTVGWWGHTTAKVHKMLVAWMHAHMQVKQNHL
jgi:hypothetical protein